MPVLSTLGIASGGIINVPNQYSVLSSGEIPLDPFIDLQFFSHDKN